VYILYIVYMYIV